MAEPFPMLQVMGGATFDGGSFQQQGPSQPNPAGNQGEQQKFNGTDFLIRGINNTTQAPPPFILSNSHA